MTQGLQRGYAMTMRNVRQVVQARAVPEVRGVTVHRTIGTPTLRHLDPFLMLDCFTNDESGEPPAQLSDQPQRGFVILTYMLDGRLLHHDSLGNRGDVPAGAVQWHKSARGAVYATWPRRIEGHVRGFRLWLNLPACEKMGTPSYQEFPAEVIPSACADVQQVRVIGGDYEGHHGPVVDPCTALQLLDVELSAGRAFTHRLPPEMVVSFFVFEGRAALNGTHVPQYGLAVLGEGDEVKVAAGAEGTRFLLLGGRPLHEPIAQQGAFVMNTQEEIRQALHDFGVRGSEDQSRGTRLGTGSDSGLHRLPTRSPGV